MEQVILLLVFLAVFLGSYSIFSFLTYGRQLLSRRLEYYTQRKKEPLFRLSSPREAVKSIISWLGKSLTPGRISRKMEAELIKADIPLRGEEFFILNILLALIPALIFFLWGRALAAMVLFVLGLGFPSLFLKMARQKRVAKFNAQIADCLVVLANSLRAGYSLLQAMEMVSREMPPPIGVEFGRTLKEVALGTPTEEALVNLGQRIESEDLDLVITAMLIQRQSGGNLAEILDRISHTIRERVRIKGEIKTLTAQGRISGYIIGALPLVLGVVISIIQPSYLFPLFSDRLGQLMLAAGVVSQILGVLVIRKIIDIGV